MKLNRFIAALLSFIMMFSIFGTTLISAEGIDDVSISEGESDAIQNDETIVVPDEASKQQDVSSGKSQTQDSIDINEDEDSNDATFVSNEENCSENEEPGEVISDNAAVDEENKIVLSDDNDVNALIDESVVKVFIDGEAADIEILSGNEFSPYLQNRTVFAAYNIGTNVVYEEEHLYHIAIYGLSIPDECELYHFCDKFDNDASLIEKLNFKYDKEENSVSFDTLSFSPFVFVEQKVEVDKEEDAEQVQEPNDLESENDSEVEYEPALNSDHESENEETENPVEISSDTNESTEVDLTCSEDSEESEIQSQSEEQGGENNEHFTRLPVKSSSNPITITFNAGEGSFSNSSTTNTVVFDPSCIVRKYVHTDNIDNAGNAYSVYVNNLAQNIIVSSPGASSAEIEVWFSTELYSRDWLAIYPSGITPNKDNYAQASISNGRLGGHGSLTGYQKPDDSDPDLHKTFAYNGDTVQFFFKSDGSTAYYGYYAIVDFEGGLSSGDYKIPRLEGKEFVGWHLEEDLSDDAIAEINYSLYPDGTIFYAEYDVPDFNISMIHYDSAVGNGKTVLTENDDCVKTYEKTSELSGTLTLQINYYSDNLQKTYNPGEFTFKVYGLEKFGLKNPTVAQNLFNATHFPGTYNPETGIIENDYWLFSNKNTFLADSSYDGMVQLVYKIGTSNTTCPIDDANGYAYVEYNNVNYSNTYFSFDLSKQQLTASITPSAVQSVSRFENPDDYYWAKYSVYGITSAQNSIGILNAPVNENWYDYVELPEGAVLYYYQDTSGSSNTVIRDVFYKAEPYEVVNGIAKYKILTSQLKNSSSQWYIGYPKSDYNVGDTVRLTIDYYGKYNKTTDNNTSPIQENDYSYLGSRTSNTFTLREYIPPVPGTLYSWNYQRRTSDEQLTPSLISNRNKLGRISGYSTITFYNEAPIDIIYGEDLVAIQNNGSYELVDQNDETLYKNYFYIPSRIVDLNEMSLQSGIIEIELWVKKIGSNEYTLEYSGTNKESSNGQSLRTNDQVVAYYWKIKNLPAGISVIKMQQTLASYSFYRDAGTYDANGNVAKSAYLMIYDQDGNLLTPVHSESEYPIQLQEADTATRDLQDYGMYMNRRVFEAPIKLDEYKGSGGIKEIDAFKQTNISSTTYQVYFFGGLTNQNGVKTIYGYDFWMTFPQICNININTIKSSVEKYTPLLTIGKYNSYSTTGYQLTAIDLSERESWIRDYLDRSTISVEDNYDGNGGKRVHIHIDYSEGLDIENYRGKLWAFIIPVTVYDADILDYGGAVNSKLLHKPDLRGAGKVVFQNGATVENKSLYNISTESDTGYTDTDIYDIDGNGDSTELLLRANASGNLTPALDAQQDFSKLVKTDNNNWKPGAAYVESGHEYTYRLRARTAATGMTHLVLYDSIEFYSPNNIEHWQGMYTGIDLTRSEAQGYIPTVYYSTSGTPGALGEDASWTLYNASVDLSTVRSLAFDYGDQIIQPNSIASVDIIITAPETDSEFYAYNIFNASWIRVDPATGTQLPGEQEMSSNVTILSLNDPIDDYKEITITKIWDDNNNERELRPDQISATLYQNDEVYATYTIKGSDNWTKNVSGLPWFDDDGNEYQYTITEDAVTGYTTEIVGYTITNTIIPNKNVPVNKLDGSSNPISGAHLQVLDSDGVILDSWISDGTTHIVEGLNMDATYTLREVQAPEGYYVSRDVIFIIDTVGNIFVIEPSGEQTATEQIAIYNYRKAVLPATGSTAAMAAQIIGLFLLSTGSIVFIPRRKRKREI